MTLLHENKKDIYGDTAERCLDILETRPSTHLRYAFDPANFVQCDVKPIGTASHALKKILDEINEEWE